MSVFIQSASHISTQEPLCNSWMDNPIFYEKTFVKSIDPDFKQFINPLAARRMGKILKRSLVTSLQVIQETGISDPDAIIVGTGLGCIENTERFLATMVQEGEQFLQPTFFMQSTHNTISSQIAVNLKCHGYNSTYAHRGISFDSSLMDAFMQFELQQINTALIGGHDEMTPTYFMFLDKVNCWKKENITIETLRNGETSGSFAGECSVEFMLENKKNDKSWCEIKGIELFYNPDETSLKLTLNNLLAKCNMNIEDIDAVMLGINGDKNNDLVYKNVANLLYPDKPLLWFKHIFGESFTSSGLGVYAAAACLHEKKIPSHLVFENKKGLNKSVKNILIHNHFENKDHSLILLSAC